jgi:hypothetical protein
MVDNVGTPIFDASGRARPLIPAILELWLERTGLKRQKGNHNSKIAGKC